MRTALTGSPTYCGFLNLTVFTSRPFLSSRHGMTRVRSISNPLRKVLQQLHTESMALLRMKLRAHDVAPSHDRRKVVPVTCHPYDVFCVKARQMVRVHEI